MQSLLRPMVVEGDTFWWVPPVILFFVAVVSSVPTFQMKGPWMAVIYTVVAFFVLCLMRGWVFVWWAGPTEYVVASALLAAEMSALFLPLAFWLGISWGFAYFMWGWSK